MNEAPLIVGMDFGSGKDYSAICIAEQLKDAGIRVVAIADKLQAVTMEAMKPFVDRMLRDMARPTGYSQSHWRKIYRQSPRMRVPKWAIGDGLRGPTSRDGQ